MKQALVESSNRQIAAHHPRADSEWQWTEDFRSADGYTVTELKWRSLGHEGEVYLYAKDYAGVRESVGSICGRDWRDYYRSVLPVVSLVEVSQSSFRGRQACNVVLEGRSPAGVSLRIDEHYIVVPNHVLLLSAAGPPTRIVALKGTITAWFAGVQFRALQVK